MAFCAGAAFTLFVWVSDKHVTAVAAVPRVAGGDGRCGFCLTLENLDLPCADDSDRKEEGGAREENYFAGERGEMKTERSRCKRTFREELHLAPCKWEQCRELGHRVEDQYDLVNGILISRAVVVRDDEHTQISSGLGS